MTSPISNTATGTTTVAASAASSVARWNSPIPYLFGGLAIMLGLIAIALVILACSYRKSSSSSNDDPNDVDDIEKPANNYVHVLQPEMEPKIVIIMPGDVNPTYLAQPASNYRNTLVEEV